MTTQPRSLTCNRNLLTAALALLTLGLFLTICALVANAQEVPAAPVAPVDAPAQVATGLTGEIIRLANAYPAFAAFLILLGSLRLFIKPLMSGVRLWTASTETKRDDEILNQVEASWLYTAFLFSLDWLTSIKLKPDQAAKSAKAVRLLLFILLPSAFILLTGCAQIAGERTAPDGSVLRVTSSRLFWSSQGIEFKCGDTSLRVNRSNTQTDAIEAAAAGVARGLKASSTP